MSRHFFGESETARRARVAGLKKRVRNCDYHVSADEIAAELLALMNAREALNTARKVIRPQMMRHFLQERLALLLAEGDGETLE